VNALAHGSARFEELESRERFLLRLVRENAVDEAIALFHPSFEELEATGMWICADQALRKLRALGPIELTDLRAVQFAPEVVRLSYLGLRAGSPIAMVQTCLWVRENGKWLRIFSQGFLT
jgi:hypothetical protein